MLGSSLILTLFLQSGFSIYYDAFTGSEITETEYLEHVADNTTFWCVDIIDECIETEGRRIDGSCNNLNQPQRGASHSPTFHFLPPVFEEGSEPRLAKSGEPLPLPRKVRTSLLASGRVSDNDLTNMVANFLVFLGADLSSVHDSVNYIFWRNCCENPMDPECRVIEIPEDDPVHRFSGVRCLNMTKPYSFQSVGCADTNTSWNRILSELPNIDLSNIYGSNVTKLLEFRTMDGGMLSYEIIDGMIWPPSVDSAPFCGGNTASLNETRCHNGPVTGMNSLLGINLFSIWFWRNHNYIAQQLAAVSPCWNDETLFQTAKDVNIAVFNQILYYNIYPTLIGYENMVNDDVISDTGDFRDLYDANFVPGMNLEFLSALRWVHTIQEGILQLFAPDGTNVGDIPIVNLTFRTGWLAKDHGLTYLTQGSFRQASGGVDYILDPDIAEIAFGPFQYGLDISANDLYKNRFFGYAPYVDYINLCQGTNITFTNFEQLADLIPVENIMILQNIYDDVNDIDLQAGLWAEKKMDGGYVPTTFSCLSKLYLKHNIKADRHWYERAERPNAFTGDQLAEIRKTTLSSFMCLNGDQVTDIQPNSFKIISEGNQLTSCDDFEQIDFSAWMDSSCSA